MSFLCVENKVYLNTWESISPSHMFRVVLMRYDESSSLRTPVRNEMKEIYTRLKLSLVKIEAEFLLLERNPDF